MAERATVSHVEKHTPARKTGGDAGEVEFEIINSLLAALPHAAAAA
ncbi:MAG TPA: hypothetical protein VIK59_11000 [Verrucomicrobiae bacterium]